MILSDVEIWEAIQSGEIIFTPSLSPEQVSTSSIDLRLGNTYTIFTPPEPGVSVHIDITQIKSVEKVLQNYSKIITLDDNDKYTLEPGHFILAYTEEYIKLPSHIAARVEGRSTLARLGLTVHQTAPTVHATFEGKLRLEICNNGLFNCEIRPRMKFCQLILERLGKPASSQLISQFQKQTEEVKK